MCKVGAITVGRITERLLLPENAEVGSSFLFLFSGTTPVALLIFFSPRRTRNFPHFSPKRFHFHNTVTLRHELQGNL
jgi:hypothetical protein